MCLDDFFAAHSWSANTIDRYHRALSEFLSEFPDPSPDTLSAGNLRAWLMSHKTWGGSARNIALNAVRAYLRWRYGDTHPALLCRLHQEPPAPQRTITTAQVAALLALFARSPTGTRDRAMLGVFLDTAARAHEIVRIETRHTDLLSRKLTFMQKGARWRHGMISPMTRDWLSAWMEQRRTVATGAGRKYLFVSLAANRNRGQPLSVEGLKTIVRRWGERAGFKLSPHDFRRGYAVMVTRNGAPQNIAMLGGGWEDERTFRRYVQSLQVEDIDRYLPTRRWGE